MPRCSVHAAGLEYPDSVELDVSLEVEGEKLTGVVVVIGKEAMLIPPVKVTVGGQCGVEVTDLVMLCGFASLLPARLANIGVRAAGVFGLCYSRLFSQQRVASVIGQLGACPSFLQVSSLPYQIDCWVGYTGPGQLHVYQDGTQPRRGCLRWSELLRLVSLPEYAFVVHHVVGAAHVDGLTDRQCRDVGALVPRVSKGGLLYDLPGGAEASVTDVQRGSFTSAASAAVCKAFATGVCGDALVQFSAPNVVSRGLPVETMRRFSLAFDADRLRDGLLLSAASISRRALPCVWIFPVGVELSPAPGVKIVHASKPVAFATVTDGTVRARWTGSGGLPVYVHLFVGGPTVDHGGPVVRASERSRVIAYQQFSSRDAWGKSAELFLSQPVVSVGVTSALATVTVDKFAACRMLLPLCGLGGFVRLGAVAPRGVRILLPGIELVAAPDQSSDKYRPSKAVYVPSVVVAVGDRASLFFRVVAELPSVVSFRVECFASDAGVGPASRVLSVSRTLVA